MTQDRLHLVYYTNKRLPKTQVLIVKMHPSLVSLFERNIKESLPSPQHFVPFYRRNICASDSTGSGAQFGLIIGEFLPLFHDSLDFFLFLLQLGDVRRADALQHSSCALQLGVCLLCSAFRCLQLLCSGAVGAQLAGELLL